MVQSKRFKPVQRVAESRERKAARSFGQSQRLMHDQEARLEELRRYHEEYLQRFRESSQMGMSASQLQEYRAFLEKLEKAIEAQKNRTGQPAESHQPDGELAAEAYAKSGTGQGRLPLRAGGPENTGVAGAA